MSILPDQPQTLTLDQLLHRHDIWRGHRNHFSNRNAVNSGYEELNALLLNGGWPLGALIEICQQRFQGEWQLFLPALLSLESGLIVLLNPPADPFSQSLIQVGIDLDRLVVVNASEKKQFLACFRELSRTGNCGAVLSWQTQDYFSYTELRKCLLAATEGNGLYALFRPSAVQQQSSPAQLRLFCQVVPSGLEVTVFKQKGMLQRQQTKPVILPLPTNWQPALAYPELDSAVCNTTTPGRKVPVFNLRGSQ